MVVEGHIQSRQLHSSTHSLSITINEYLLTNICRGWFGDGVNNALGGDRLYIFSSPSTASLAVAVDKLASAGASSKTVSSYN